MVGMKRGSYTYNSQKENYIILNKKRIICISRSELSAPTCRISKETTVDEKRPTKETFVCAKEPSCIERGLYKREIYVCLSELSAINCRMSKQATVYEKKPAKETYMYATEPIKQEKFSGVSSIVLLYSKEGCQKRPPCMKRDL